MMQHRSLGREGRQWGCDRAEHGRGSREVQEKGGGKHSMPGGAGEAQQCGEMGNESVGRAAARKTR